MYSNEGNKYIFIHIPKNGGKSIRNRILRNKNNTIILNYWGRPGKDGGNLLRKAKNADFARENKLDIAHLPYMYLDKFVSNISEYQFNAYIRNPYYKIISACSWLLYGHSSDIKPDKFKNFVKNDLNKFNFDRSFNYKIIHLYPQYMFLIDKNNKLNEKIKLNRMSDDYSAKRYNLKEYYDDEVLKIINDIYQNDFKYLNYQMVDELKNLSTL